jgi:hypothetical protein
MPIIEKYKNSEVSTKEFLEWLFGTKYRYIDYYRTTKRVVIPGRLKLVPKKMIRPVPAMALNRNTTLLVRRDEREGGHVDISFVRRDNEYVYRLRPEEWHKFAQSLEAVTDA